MHMQGVLSKTWHLLFTVQFVLLHLIFEIWHVFLPIKIVAAHVQQNVILLEVSWPSCWQRRPMSSLGFTSLLAASSPNNL